jgi:RNA polymerase-binding transcription factor DksA
MTKHDVARYRRRLRAMASRLSGEVDGLRDEALRPTGSEAGGEVDERGDPGAEAADEAAAVALLGPEGHTLAEVNAALDRIDRGTFGVCDACSRPVSRARLDALPFARRCAACARADEPGRP